MPEHKPANESQTDLMVELHEDGVMGVNPAHRTTAKVNFSPGNGGTPTAEGGV